MVENVSRCGRIDTLGKSSDNKFPYWKVKEWSVKLVKINILK